MSLRTTALALAAMMVFALPVSAQQGKGPSKVPPGHRPAPGMCRIWIDGVPPGRQPRATDCATARRNAPANSRVIYGPDHDGRRVREHRHDADLKRDAELNRDAERKQDAGDHEPELKRRTDAKRSADSDRNPPRVKR